MSTFVFSCLLVVPVVYGTTPSGDVEILGPEEVVFDWTTDKCDKEDIPDIPARAFRDADGRVQLISSHFVGRRMIGKTLDTVKRDCSIIMESHKDPRPSQFNDHEWISAVYTLDGKTIYALVHNEYHGHKHGRQQCPSGVYSKCWYNALTFAKSTDKGRSYSHPQAPHHLVANVPYPYEPDTGPVGVFTGSNIIYKPDDGYYYTMLHVVRRFLQNQGASVMRTKTLDDPTSWRAWSGKDFSVRFINPYEKADADPAKHVCQPVSRKEIGTMHASLTFNTYFGKFLLAGVSLRRDQERKKNITGFYFSLSDDLIHWTPRKLIMDARQPSTPDQPGEILVYPSLIDPTDTSRNFEKTGRRPYLYYTRWHTHTPEDKLYDRDLVRIPIQFN